MRRTALTFLTAIALACAGISSAGAQATDGGPNNIVYSHTTGTGAADIRSNLQVGSYAGDHLQSTNLARAESQDCTDCKTVATAVQVVFATAHPSKSEPQNVGLALNVRCVRCATFAYAYQYVVQTAGPVHLSRHARRQIRDLRRRIAEATNSNLAFRDLDARLTALSAELKADIDKDLQNAHEHAHGHVHQTHSEGPQQ